MNQNDNELRELLVSIIWQDLGKGGYDNLPPNGKPRVEEALLALRQYVREQRAEELQAAVSQFILTTKSNPHNFSEYATHRLSQLTKEVEDEQMDDKFYKGA